MSGPTNSREIEVVNAIADTIIARTSLIPTTTLKGVSAAGASAGTLTDPSLFTRRGYLHFFDNTFEPFAAMAALDPSTGVFSLDYQGFAEHGLPPNLQHDHADGAVVATNLMLHRPIGIGEMLRTGRPVIAIWPQQGKKREFTFGSTITPLNVRIQIHVSLMQFDSAPIDPEVYNQLQQNACYDGLNEIGNALDNNRHLMAAYNAPGNHAMGLGDGNGPFATSMWDVFTDSKVIDIPQAIGAMDVIVRPLKFNRSHST